MGRFRLESTVFLGALAVIGAIGIAMYRLSYDVWAGFVIAPVLIVVILPVIRRLLGHDLASLYPLMAVGYVLKLAGSCARYYVVFDAYGKNADAERYFDTGSILAAGVRSGRSSVFSVLPLARDTAFIVRLTALVLTFLGPTRLGGFFVFSTMAYLGTVCFVRAGAMGVPGLAQRRYALICIVAPSLVFWPSSLGKEAWMITCLGPLSLGTARVLCFQGRAGGLLLIALSGLGIGVVRPHLAANFVGSATIGLAFSVMAPPEPISLRRRGSILGFAVVALGGLVLVLRRVAVPQGW